MKIIFSLLFVSALVFSCESTKTITANPDDQAATSGTLGSAKMTNGLPDQDSAKVLRDSTIRRQ
jgi:hypothetical protein